MRKRGVTSPLDLLPLHQKQALAAWLSTGGKDGLGLSYTAAAKRLASECGVQTSPAALCAWRRRCLRAAGMDAPTLPSKARVYSPLDRLSPAIHAALVAWLTTGGRTGDGLPYAEVVRRMRAEHGVKTNVASLCAYRAKLARRPAETRLAVTTADAAGIKTISVQSPSAAVVETAREGDRTLTVRITLPRS